jgi:hypothetical protein
LPEECTRRSMPKRPISLSRPKLAEITPIDPTIEDGSA